MKETIVELMLAATEIRTNIFTNINDFNFDMPFEKVSKIIKLMPVMFINNKDSSFFLNLQEFIYTPDVFELIFMKDSSEGNKVAAEHIDDLSDTTRESHGGGQPSIVSKFPRIVDTVTEFTKQHGFAAQSRRREETGYSSGVTIGQIQEHLYQQFPKLKEHKISHTTIRRMFQAPDKSNKASSRYMGYVNAKVGSKMNSYREPNIDAHYLFARNKMRLEFASLFSNEIAMLSVDDMSKIKVGAPAVSRYHQIKHFFPINDAPNFADHDFPVPGYLFNVSGYMFLEPNKNNAAQSFEGLCSASVYDAHQSVEFEPDFTAMTLDSFEGNIFQVLSRQMALHLNIRITELDCKNIVFEKIKDKNTDTWPLDQLDRDSINTILEVVSKSFK